MIELTTIDRGPLGSAQFRTTVDLTGDSRAQIPPVAAYRFICLYALGHLNEPSLREACQSLWDIYSWQIERENAPTPTPVERGFVKAAAPIRAVERQPFTISDDE